MFSDIINQFVQNLMIPTSYRIPSYEDLQQMEVQQVKEMIKNGAKCVFYDQLVIDIKNINHPGGQKIMDPFINNLSLSIKGTFQKNNHSRYAEVLFCVNTIGRIKKSQKQIPKVKIQGLQGKNLFQKVKGYEQFRLHRQILQKIDFSKPIFYQIDQLTVQQKQCLVDIPTMVQDTSKTKFMNTKMEEIMYTSNFWLSTVCFQIFIVLGILYLLNHNQEGRDLVKLVPYFFFGLAKWTLIQYYFHRFLLHQDLKAKPTIQHHLMHHAFPNMENKLALSISKVIIYMIGFYLLYSLFLQNDKRISLLLGILVGLTLYDVTHYYFHFGPDLNIPLLIDLKRNHLKHHYRDPNRGFGVSNTFWDKIFKTEHTT